MYGVCVHPWIHVMSRVEGMIQGVGVMYLTSVTSGCVVTASGIGAMNRL